MIQKSNASPPISDEKKYSMFHPKTKKGLKFDYPELGRIDEFEKLNKSEMLFVWYYACEASPYSKIEIGREARKLAMRSSFGKKIGHKDKEAYLSGNYPNKIVDAVDKMREYRMGVRIRAKKMVEKMINQYESIINAGPGSMSDESKYVVVTKNIREALPSLIVQSESGFGLIEGSQIDSNLLSDDGSLIDEYHGK